MQKAVVLKKPIRRFVSAKINPVMHKPKRLEEDEEWLYALVAERIKNDKGVTYPAEEVYSELGVNADDLDEIPMEYGVDFV